MKKVWAYKWQIACPKCRAKGPYLYFGKKVDFPWTAGICRMCMLGMKGYWDGRERVRADRVR